jgi:hypothetical protein
MQELLDLTTSHASTMEAVREIFCKYRVKAQAEPMDEARITPGGGKARRTAGGAATSSSASTR